MEKSAIMPLYYYCGFTLFLALLLHAILRSKSSAAAGEKKLPPGPWRLPVIGSIHHFLLHGGLPHHTMRDLSRRHGPVMLLKVCELPVVVVSSASAARDVFKRPGTAFEQRPTSPGLDDLHAAGGEHAHGVALAPYGEHWRLLRRVLVAELLAARRVDAAFLRRVRRDEAARLVASAAAAASSSPAGEPVDAGEMVGRFVAGVSVRAILGEGDTLPDRDGFLRMMRNATDLSSNFDLRDLFPSSRLVRMLPRSGKARGHMMEVFRLFDDILRRHEERRAVISGDDGDDGGRDMVSALLKVKKEDGMGGTLTPGVIRSMVMDVFGGAIDTQIITLQWAMAELVANPRVMEKAQLEIRRVLAGKGRVEEEALREMRYLKTVIKETLRLHPPTALIVRVCLQDDQKIQGYDVPKGTIVVTNAWAISRDPEYWDDPDSFVPERFEGERDLDYGGSDFSFTPFGAGRRICPGIYFAQANIEIALASLLYHFDWELPSGVKEEDVDMTEVFGITVKRKADLLLHPIPRVPVVCE
ncbi:unnamed protein product [Urochloa humidicola]